MRIKLWASSAGLITLMLLIASSLLQPVSYALTPTPSIPTPLPRVYSQAEIHHLRTLIEERYGIGFSYPTEWNAANASEVMWFTDGLHQILEALDIATYYLYIYGEPDEDVTPIEYFRQHFDRAHIEIDRTRAITGNFAGNTLPRYANSQVIGYTIQLTGLGMDNPYTLVHELGHVLDGLLEDAPHLAFVAELGGEWTTDRWIPGEGYTGNEAMFPRAVGGPNEDFADTFGQMLVGNLSPEVVAVRYDFMREYLPIWLTAIQALPETTAAG